MFADQLGQIAHSEIQRRETLTRQFVASMDNSSGAQTCPHCGASCKEDHHYCPACGFPIATLGSSESDKLIGRTLPGGYHILDLISVGGMGRVYRAEQSVLGRTVAVKIIHPHLLSDENSAIRFMTEARAASQLNHPNSISVFDFGRTEDGQPYLVMEFLRGKDLARVAYEEGPLPFSTIVDVLRQALAALAEAHDHGIVHRDLKPENIILEPLRRGGNFVKVVDFGLAKLKADSPGTGVTSPGIVCGTPDYMAPEQGRGDPIDGRSDLYAVGVILFQLLTGRLPFEAESPTQVVMMHLSIPPPDPRQVAPGRKIPDPLVAVTMKALDKSADRRYQDALEFADALAEALAEAESMPPEQARTTALSLVPGGFLACPSCGATVPMAKYCCDCGARLPVRSHVPDTETPPQLPLPLVAREDDLAFLEERYSLVDSSVVATRLVGEEGAGKTRLLQEFVSRLRARGDFVVTATPDPFFAEVSYHALSRAVLGLARLTENDVRAEQFGEANMDAKRGLAELFRLPGAALNQRSALERRYGLGEALRWALERGSRAAAPAKLVLLLDDLHRMDGASRHAFADCIEDPPACPALIVATHRPGFESQWPAQSAAARVLAGIPPPTAIRLLRSTRSAERLTTGDEHQRRGVLAMYVEQLVRFSLEGGNNPPTRLADLIALRVDTLEPDARRALQGLAVLGDAMKTDDVAELMPKGQLAAAAVTALEHAGMIRVEEGRLVTSHPLLREIALGSIPAAVRRELHSKALKASERRGAPLEVSALHAYHAGDSFQALFLLEQVADRAALRGDGAGEVLALRRALEIARQEISRGELDDPLRAVLIFSRKLGTALTSTGNFADAEGVLREALDIAGPSGADRAKVLFGLAHVAHGRRRGGDALGYIDAAIEAARQSGATELESSLSDTRRVWAS